MQINLGGKPLIVHADEYKTKIDVLAGEARSRFLTVSPGQELTYLLKLSEAKSYPQPVNPWVSAEALATGKTEQQVVNGILSAASSWEQTGITIESARMLAKSKITSATSVKEMYDSNVEFTNTIDNLYP